ncbi:DUF6456 domain-containing protein [Brevundimonas sp.]|uniref:DUF6456 domain-containing protein n=1 Tax=Brevundimonas sp. TaxID=1871086 RepID=UPI0026381CCA|nr:DUF6456 domain-containing protein [Brevundimonas sp.]
MSGPAVRARGLLARGGWIDLAAADGSYALRIGGDRRARAAMTLNEATFRALVESPGLKARKGGGWVERPAPTNPPSPPHGAPGRIEGERAVMEPDGRLTLRRANLGESPIGWLARRRDAEGRPWLSPAEIAAAERLRLDAERAQSGPSLTMRWDALPRAGGGGSSGRLEPGDRALAAWRRVAEAMEACGPATRGFVEHICIRGRPIQLAEQDFGLRRRAGKWLLKQGLAALADHYRIL